MTMKVFLASLVDPPTHTQIWKVRAQHIGFIHHTCFCSSSNILFSSDTNYYFSVTSQKSEGQEVSEGLRGGLDRLAQFFISPKFEESMVERELQAVDSEYRNGKTNDSWRNYQFLKATSNQKHPFSK